ncbi:MAG: arginine--tRNA ligase [Pseudomonadota bacterium]|nr:arginine--tRNA ligase [Pseudomonadota bacterium]
MIPALLQPILDAVAATVAPLSPDGLGEVESVAPTGNPAHGDYQWNFAFRIAKAQRMNPRALAERLAPLLQHPAITKVEVAGPGFINLTLDDAWIARTVAAQVAEPNVGIAPEGAGRTVIIDFSSPNVAKRMHIGHMRSTHIGDALVRMHRASGWNVVGDNHIGDWGTQFGKLIVAYRSWLDPEAFEADPIGELERLYVEFGRRAKEDPALGDAARAEIAKLQKGDPENTALWRQFLAISMAEFEAVYRRLGIRFDEVLGESAYRDLTDQVVTDLLAAGIAEVSEGATIVRFEHDVAIFRKKDGADNYGTSDIACLRYREARWHPARIVYVVDMRQQRHFQQVFEVGRRLGATDAELVHVWFGMLVLPEGVKMGTREGNVIRLVDLLDESVRRARAVVDAKSPNLDEAERAAIAEAVGVGAVRYADLSQNPQTNVTFDWDRMLSLEGNTAPYLLYSHARCASVLAKALRPEEGGEAPDLGAIVIGHPLERELLLALARYPEMVAAATRGFRPNQLAEHLFEVANRFNRFYHDCPVLKGGEARASRLALVEATRRVLRHGMELLGLSVLDRM